MHKTFLLIFLIAVLSASAKPVAKWYTSMGEFCCELRDDLVPVPTNNFIDLATGNKIYTDGDGVEQTIDYPFYDGLLFHRVIKSFMIQGGCPLGTGTGGPGYEFDDVFMTDSLNFTYPGVLAMANSGPNTNGSQYFITVDPYTYGNGKYVIFGSVVENYSVVEAISKVETNSSDKPLIDVVTDSLRIMDFSKSYPLQFTDSVITEPVVIDLSNHFFPIEGITPVFTIESSNPQAVTVAINGPIATITQGETNGRSIVTLKASGDNGKHFMDLSFEAASFPYPTPKSGYANCLNFDGTNDYVTIADNETFTDLSQFTAAGWFKFNDNEKTQGLFAKASNIFNGWCLELRDTILKSTIFTSDGKKTLVTEFTPETNVWYYLALKFTGNSIELLVFDNTSSSLIYSTSIDWENSATINNKVDQPIHIGKFIGYYFNGFADNLLFIKKALTLEELTTTKVKTDNFIPADDILAFVPFDSNYGNTTECQGVITSAELQNMSMSNWQESTVKPCLVTLENTPSSSFKLPGDYLFFSGGFTSSILSSPTNGTLSINNEDYTYTPATDFSGIDSLSYQLAYNSGAEEYLSKPATYYFSVVNSLNLSENDFIPNNISMQQNYPNPFNPETMINFTIKKQAIVSLLVYNNQGQMVKKLLDQELNQGSHTCLFKANNLPSGSYYYKLKVNDNEITKKMLLIK